MDSDLVIVGAGPAGAMAGLRAAQLGLSPILIDKEEFPREKPCGGGLTANAVDFLIENNLLGLLDKIEKFSFKGYRIYSSSGQIVEAPLRSRNNARQGFVVRRTDFDNALVKEAVATGCRFLPKIRAINVNQANNSVAIETIGGLFEGKAVIMADGSGISLTRKILPRAKQGETLAAMAFFEDVSYREENLLFFMDKDIGYGYGWVFLLPGNKANIGAGADVRLLRRRGQSVKDIFREFISKEPIKTVVKGAKRVTKVRSFPLRMAYPNATFKKGDVLFAGDAANLVYPLTGEGISYAMQSGKVAAEVIQKAIEEGDMNYLKNYKSLVSQELSEFRIAWLLKKSLGRPWFQNFLFNTAAKDKNLSQKAIGVLENTTPCRELFHPKIIWTLFKKGLLSS